MEHEERLFSRPELPGCHEPSRPARSSWRQLGGLHGEHACRRLHGGDTGGDNGFGNALYVQHHNPFVYFPNLVGELSTHVKPLTSMVTDLDSANPPAFVWVTPNTLDDMHDGPLTTGDTWLSQQIPVIQGTQWYRAGGTIILLWDEGQDSDTSGIAGGAGGHIAGIVISQAHYGSAPSATPVDDSGILRSIEQAYGLGYLNDAADPTHGSVGGL